MDVIKILPEALANKIAAGEVVERPASVVKELVENAIDANAKKITVIIKNAGKSLIRVIDDGHGMSENDAVNAFERHATSKIAHFSDIENLLTMGFRGEALPSIAAVSQVELITRTKENNVAHTVQIEGSVVENITKSQAEIGTSIAVKNLFYNVPARKNFLKTNATENNHINVVLKNFYLGNPNIHFVYYNDDQKVYEFHASSMEKRISDVLGANFFSGLLPLHEELGEVELSGYVLKPSLARHSRGQQFLFVNNRIINSRYIFHAIINAYGHKIEKTQFPGYVLYLKIDPALIDINVHPTKMDVRFSNDRMIYNFFLSAVKKALNVDEVVPEIEEGLFTTSTGQPPQEPKSPTIIKFDDLQFKPQQTFGKNLTKKKTNIVPNQASLQFTYKSDKDHVDDRLDVNQPIETKQITDQQALWQIHNRYILSQIKSGLVIIDQHVAHERILYEKILNMLKGQKRFFSQQLLFPQTVDLSPEDFNYFVEIEDMLMNIGYSVKAFGGRTVVIEAIPGDIKIGNEIASLMEIIDYHKENLSANRNPLDQMAAAFSCKNAIKSGERLTHTEMQSLVDQLFATTTPYFCPHGRPIIVTISLQELDKKFKRI